MQATVHISDLAREIAHHPGMQAFQELFTGLPGLKIHLKGLNGSLPAMVCAGQFKQQHRPFLIILPDRDEAAFFYSDLVTLLSDREVFFFPSSFKRLKNLDRIENENIVLRTEVLNQLRLEASPVIAVTYTEALVERVVSREVLTDNTLVVAKGHKLSMAFLQEVLAEYGFERGDFVYEPGQYSIRGGIVDVFSYSGDLPYRLEFFGNEVETIRTFNVETQLSLEEVSEIQVIPNVMQKLETESRLSLLEFLPNDVLVWIRNAPMVGEQMAALEQYLHDDPNFGLNFVGHKEFMAGLKTRSLIEMGQQSLFPGSPEVVFRTSPQPATGKNFDLLTDILSQHFLEGYHNYILTENQKQLDRLASIFRELKAGDEIFIPAADVLHEGWVDHETKVAFFTDHQIFERYHRFRLRSNFTRKESLSLSELLNLHPGDYVVHADHGIGKFAGLTKIENNGKPQESITLVYQDGDVLFVNIHSLHRISKYKGKDGEPPRVHKLGSGVWQRLKDKTKKKVKDIARELILLYSKRREEKGFEFSPDTYLQTELEASFIYEDTPDQVKATADFKRDMESATPMDRLVCGDVGFGKTEIAVRAAFKAATDGKQVAVLVPTTILAMQHYYTFSERLRNFPVKVDYISRMRKASDAKEVLKNLEAGKLDILIGTHRLVSEDVRFTDLGLLIIDEEQKFGVNVKEKLRKLKINVDTLTLTATPIPRTLQFSLMGARDLSIINTPPPNRYPIVTEVIPFNPDIITEAIEYELSRGGQVFFIHNRIANIYEIEGMIRSLCPRARTIVGHGQMDGPKLEGVMLSFMAGDYDILISTTIIESGLDISNANTIFINDAQHFGLSDLHQLRGRVGRSNKKAFCYLLAPPLSVLPDDSRRRLRAIEEFSELGSGFNISLQDLDIRGAGNLLGGEQSGFISDIGFETYHQILNEAMQELHEEEFKGLFDEGEEIPTLEKPDLVNECHIDTDLSVLFPDTYVSSISERIKLYRELDNIQDEKGLDQFRENLIDRFGSIPIVTQELLSVVKLRWTARKLGIEKISLRNGQMTGYFTGVSGSSFFQSDTFGRVLSNVQRLKGQARLKDVKGKLSITFDDTKDVASAIRQMESISY